MGHAHMTWQDLTPRKRRAAVILGTTQVALAVWAGIDLARRPAEEIKGGHKLPWALALLVNWVGPIAYLTVGREPKRL